MNPPLEPFSQVERRLGHRGAGEVKLHPWFKDVDWPNLSISKAAFIPVVDDETDTTYFEQKKPVSMKVCVGVGVGVWVCGCGCGCVCERERRDGKRGEMEREKRKERGGVVKIKGERAPLRLSTLNSRILSDHSSFPPHNLPRTTSLFPLRACMQCSQCAQIWESRTK